MFIFLFPCKCLIYNFVIHFDSVAGNRIHSRCLKQIRIIRNWQHPGSRWLGTATKGSSCPHLLPYLRSVQLPLNNHDLACQQPQVKVAGSWYLPTSIFHSTSWESASSYQNLILNARFKGVWERVGTFWHCSSGIYVGKVMEYIPTVKIYKKHGKGSTRRKKLPFCLLYSQFPSHRQPLYIVYLYTSTYKQVMYI